MDSIFLYPAEDFVPCVFILNSDGNSGFDLDMMDGLVDQGSVVVKTFGSIPLEKIESEIKRLNEIREGVRTTIFDLHYSANQIADLQIGNINCEKFRKLLFDMSALTPHSVSMDHRTSVVDELCKKLDCQSAVITLSRKAHAEPSSMRMFQNRLQQSFYEIVHISIGMQIFEWQEKLKGK